MTQNHHRCIAAVAMIAVSLAAACGGVTDAGPSGVGLFPEVSSVPAFGLARIVVRGTALSTETYSGSIGGTAITLGRSDDSTLAFILPDIPAGRHALSVSIGADAPQADLMVTAGVRVANPVGFANGVDSAFASTLAGIEATVSAASHHDFMDRVALSADLAAARASLDSARRAFAALSATDQQEVANILRATMPTDAAVGASAQRSAAPWTKNPGFCDDPNIARDVEDNEKCAEEAKGWFSDIEFEKDLEVCSTAAQEAAQRGIRAQIRNYLWHAVNGCHYTKVAEWSSKTWGSTEHETTVDYAYNPNLTVGSSASAGAAPPARFTFGASMAFTHVLAFRPMIASDIGKVPAATEKAGILRGVAQIWARFNALRGGVLKSTPATLERITSARSRPLKYPVTRLKLGTIEPATVEGTAVVTNGEWMLNFDATDRTREIPFGFDVIYDGGRYGSDTVRVAAVLGDSAAIYESAMVGRWKATPKPEFVEVHSSYYVVLRSEISSNLTTRTGVFQQAPREGECPWSGWRLVGSYCEADLHWNVLPRDGRYFFAGNWFGHATPLTMPPTTFSTDAHVYTRD